MNDERTRTFLALSASSSCGGGGGSSSQQAGSTAGSGARGGGGAPRAGPSPGPLDPLLRAIDAVSKAFQLHGLPRFYAAPRPHVSVAWLLGDQAPQVEAAMAAPAAQAAAARLAAARWEHPVACMVCRTGQRVHTVWEARRS